MNRLFLLLPLILILFSGGARASHLVGGDLTYSCLGKNLAGRNVYEISLNVYRDCRPNDFFPTNTPFDRVVNVFVLDGGTGQVVEVIAIPLQDSVIIDLDNGNPCVPPPSDLCYTTASYITTIELEDNPNGYHLAWGRCCRNETVQNIFDPGDQGMVLYAFIPSTVLCNNSPVFNNLLPTYICLADQFDFDHSASDADGDSLAYRITVPFTAGSSSDVVPVMGPPPYQNVAWQPPYGPGNIMGGSPPLAIDPVTGRLTVRPGQIGQFVFSVTVLEYRGGLLISELKRDIQINVIGCPINFPPEIGEPTGGISAQDTLKLRLGEETCFSFEVIDVNGPGLPEEEIEVTASGSVLDPGQVLGDLPIITGNRGLAQVDFQFCWTPDCEITPGRVFSLILTAEDENSCPAPNVVKDSFLVQILPAIIEVPDLRCVSVEGQDQVSLSWQGIPTGKQGYAGFEIERNAGSGWQTVATLNDPALQSWTDNGAVAADQNQYCYRLRARRSCPANAVSDYSREVCSIVLADGPIQGNSVSLSWNRYTVWPNPEYSLKLVGNGQSLAENLPDTTFLLQSCDLSGQILVQLTDPQSGCVVRSAPTGEIVLVNQSPPIPEICAASFDTLSNQINISWTPVAIDDFKRWEIYRRNSSSSFFELVWQGSDDGQQSVLDQPPSIPGGYYCYQLVLVDECEKRSPSAEHCTIGVNGSATDRDIRLEWTAYSGWDQPSAYELYRKNPSGELELIGDFGAGQRDYTDLDLDPEVTLFCYRLKGVNTSGSCGSFSWSPEICVPLPPRVFVPNAFSPNGDGRNDRFVLKGLYLQTFQMQIFNRWGRLVYTSKDPEEGWNGRDPSGRELPEGIYSYRLQMSDFSGREWERSGSITLLR